MLTEIEHLDQTTIIVIGGFMLTHIGGIVGAYLSIRDRLTRIETKIDIHDKDLNGLGLFLGTERAKAELAKAPLKQP